MDQRFKYAKLTLDEPRSIYYSGQTVFGLIECELEAPITYSAITLFYSGTANVSWSEYEYEEYNGIRRNVEVKYRGQEEYFNLTQCISGGSAGAVNLPAGVHKIPFQIQIPTNAPSSFSGERGSIAYKIIAVIEFPPPTMGRESLEAQLEVVDPLDYNRSFDALRQPVELEFEEVYSCCCSSSPLNLKISLPTRGYCPGQAIPITVHADNQSSVEVKKIEFQLTQKTCYHSQEPPSDFIPPVEILASVKSGPILSNSQRTLKYDLVVPPMIAPNLEHCSIIDVGYFLNVIVKLSGCNDDLEDEEELSIGLVPLASLLQGQPYVHPMQSDLPQAPIPGNHTEAAAMQQQSVQTATHVQNSNAYPTASPYPGNPYSTSNPYPNSTSPYPNSETIPLMNIPEKNIGFVMPQNQGVAPYPGSNAPYPGSNAPYPGSNAPYPGSNAPYPGSNLPYSPSAPPPS